MLYSYAVRFDVIENFEFFFLKTKQGLSHVTVIIPLTNEWKYHLLF